MFKNLFSKILNRPSAQERKFWRAVGILIVFAAIGAAWMLFESLKY